jgi:Ca2+/Na+ antiporter
LYTDAISHRTRLGKAFLGLLLLSTATGLPEITTTTAAILAGKREWRFTTYLEASS